MTERSSPLRGWVELGRVSGVFGVKGELRLFLHNRDSDLLERTRAVLLVSPSGEQREVRLTARSGAGGRVIGRVDGLTDRDEAAALKDWTLSIRRDDLPQVGDGEFYVRDVLGSEAVVDGTVVGRVVDVHSTGPLEVFELRLSGGRTAYVPSLADQVLEIADGRVVFASGSLAELE